ncbi:MAG: hypothetical protein QM636_05645 [Rhizobium sp.]
MKPAINPPPADDISQTRYMDACIFALEPSVESLVATALEAGWDEASVLLALINNAMSRFEKARLPSQVMHS